MKLIGKCQSHLTKVERVGLTQMSFAHTALNLCYDSSDVTVLPAFTKLVLCYDSSDVTVLTVAQLVLCYDSSDVTVLTAFAQLVLCYESSYDRVLPTQELICECQPNSTLVKCLWLRAIRSFKK